MALRVRQGEDIYRNETENFDDIERHFDTPRQLARYADLPSVVSSPIPPIVEWHVRSNDTDDPALATWNI